MEPITFLPLIKDQTQEDKFIYKADDILEHGEFNSVVFKGRYKNEDICIRIIPGIFQSPEQVTEDINKLKLIKCHENLLQYHYLELTQHQLVVVSEAFKINLESHLHNLPTVPIMKQALNGLNYLHEQGVVHGNLKPTNILIFLPKGYYPDKPHSPLDKPFVANYAGTVKLTGFGMTNVFKELIECQFKSGVLFDVVDWMAPEILVSLRDNYQYLFNSTEADMFSFGCLLHYALFHGHHPFGDVLERLANAVNCEPKFRSELRVSITQKCVLSVVSVLLSKIPGNRPSSRAIASHPFFWDLNKKLGYLVHVEKLYEKEKTVQIQLDKLNSVIFPVGKVLVTTSLDKELFDSMKNASAPDKCSVGELLHAILHTCKDGLSYNALTAFCGSGTNVVKYWENKFPFLIEIIWVSCQKFGKQYDTLTEYYETETYPFSQVVLNEYKNLADAIKD